MSQTNQLDLANPKAQPPAQKVQQRSFAELVRDKVSTVLVGKKADQFVTDLISLTQQDPNLHNCLPMSLISAALQTQSLNLSLNKNLGQAWVVPFKDKKIKAINERTGEPFLAASFQIGYKGYIQLAIRSGYYRKINVLAIKESELKSYDPLAEDIHVELIDDELQRESASTIGYYAMFEYLNGFRKTMYWSKGKMLAHADRYSQAFSLKATSGKYPKVSFADYEAGNVRTDDLWKYSSFWYKDFDGMACKTMLRQILTKWGIMSVEMQQAIEKDMHTIDENGQSDGVIDAEFTEMPQGTPQEDDAPEFPPADELSAPSQTVPSPAPETVTCPNSETTVRVAVECVKCKEYKKCPMLNAPEE